MRENELFAHALRKKREHDERESRLVSAYQKKRILIFSGGFYTQLSSTSPAIKLKPPKGVIMPNQVPSLIPPNVFEAKRYNDPANNTIPTKMQY